MSFAPFYIRHKTHIKVQFQPLSPDGILFYTAQHLGTQSGKGIPARCYHTARYFCEKESEYTGVIQAFSLCNSLPMVAKFYHRIIEC